MNLYCSMCLFVFKAHILKHTYESEHEYGYEYEYEDDYEYEYEHGNGYEYESILLNVPNCL